LGYNKNQQHENTRQLSLTDSRTNVKRQTLTAFDPEQKSEELPLSENKENYRINMLCLQLAAILQRILNHNPTHTDEKKGEEQ